MGKIAKRRQIATDSKVYVCSDIDISEVLFHYVMFCGKENKGLSRMIYRISFSRIP